MNYVQLLSSNGWKWHDLRGGADGSVQCVVAVLGWFFAADLNEDGAFAATEQSYYLGTAESFHLTSVDREDFVTCCMAY